MDIGGRMFCVSVNVCIGISFGHKKLHFYTKKYSGSKLNINGATKVMAKTSLERKRMRKVVVMKRNDQK